MLLLSLATPAASRLHGKAHTTCSEGLVWQSWAIPALAYALGSCTSEMQGLVTPEILKVI